MFASEGKGILGITGKIVLAVKKISFRIIEDHYG